MSIARTPDFCAFLGFPRKHKFELYAGGVLGAARQRIQSLRNGMIQMSVESTTNLSQFAPDLSLLDMPYLIRSREGVKKLLDSEIGKEMFAPIQKNLGALPLAGLMSTFRILSVNKAAKNLEELQHFKIRTSNSKEHITSVNALGFTATPMPYSEAFTGLQQKVIEGIDLDLPSIREDHFYEVAPNIFLADYIPVIMILTINEKFFKKMPPEDQEIFLTAAKLYDEAVGNEFIKYEEEGFRELAEKPGVTITKLTADEMEAWRKTSLSAYDSLSDKQKETVAKIREAVK